MVASVVLGVPTIRGNSDVIESKPWTSGAPGEPGIIHTDGTIKVSDGKTPTGIVGKTTFGTTEFIRCGMGVPIRIASNLSPAIGGIVYITTATGVIVVAGGGGIEALNATFASTITRATDPDTGLLIAAETTDAVLIDFPGGL